MNKLAIPLLSIMLFQACASAPSSPESGFQQARNVSSTSLSWTELGGVETALIDGSLVVVRVNPAVASLELINPPESSASIGRLARRRGLSVAINAAMFGQDYVTSIGYMRSFDRINNPRISPKLKGFLMFHPKKTGLPLVRINTGEGIDSYDTVFQTHRMIDEKGNILWKKGASIFRQVGLVGTDRGNRLLFFYHPGRSDVHEMVSRILELGLDLTGLLYLDGGNHGALVLSGELGRSYNTWISLPNVLGVRAGN